MSLLLIYINLVITTLNIKYLLQLFGKPEVIFFDIINATSNLV
jgi:hypothetical protein